LDDNEKAADNINIHLEKQNFMDINYIELAHDNSGLSYQHYQTSNSLVRELPIK
jgi:hypothetical protein